jgi:hypothetical protein
MLTKDRRNFSDEIPILAEGERREIRDMRKGREKVLSGKMCECGCGQETFLITDSQKSKGLKKGEPHRFLKHHRKNRYSGKWYKEINVSVRSKINIHRFLAESALGKPLPLGCEVHHHNGTKVGGPLVICQDHAYQGVHQWEIYLTK